MLNISLINLIGLTLFIAAIISTDHRQQLRSPTHPILVLAL